VGWRRVVWGTCMIPAVSAARTHVCFDSEDAGITNLKYKINLASVAHYSVGSGPVCYGRVTLWMLCS